MNKRDEPNRTKGSKEYHGTSPSNQRSSLTHSHRWCFHEALIMFPLAVAAPSAAVPTRALPLRTPTPTCATATQGRQRDQPKRRAAPLALFCGAPEQCRRVHRHVGRVEPGRACARRRRERGCASKKRIQEAHVGSGIRGIVTRGAVSGRKRPRKFRTGSVVDASPATVRAICEIARRVMRSSMLHAARAGTLHATGAACACEGCNRAQRRDRGEVGHGSCVTKWRERNLAGAEWRV